MAGPTRNRTPFFVEIIKPSHYDDEGYVIQWVRGFIPSNSLACLYALVYDTAERRVLGEDVDVVVNAYDETNTVIPVQAIVGRIRRGGGRGLVLMAGVQTNQFPRAADLAREFCAAGIAVAIGGFHVSGCMAMLPELPPEIQALQADGVTLFAGEAEGRMDQLLTDAVAGQMRPVYNFLDDLPDLRGQPTPILPPDMVPLCDGTAPFDAGRGCPFRCSFCTIINVQGRKSRYRDPDDVERLVRANAAQGVKRLFITDDDLARNRNWEPIIDRLIWLREKENLHLRFTIQVDTQCHKVPRFIEKVTRENPLLFYPRRLWEMYSTYAAAGAFYLWLQRLRKRIEQDPSAASYADEALSKPDPAASRPTMPGPGGCDDQTGVPGGPPVLVQLGRPRPRSA
jgi:pyruvate-formate lyase-activating enzyme